MSHSPFDYTTIRWHWQSRTLILSSLVAFEGHLPNKFLLRLCNPASVLIDQQTHLWEVRVVLQVLLQRSLLAQRGAGQDYEHSTENRPHSHSSYVLIHGRVSVTPARKNHQLHFYSIKAESMIRPEVERKCRQNCMHLALRSIRMFTGCSWKDSLFGFYPLNSSSRELIHMHCSVIILRQVGHHYSFFMDPEINLLTVPRHDVPDRWIRFGSPCWPRNWSSPQV